VRPDYTADRRPSTITGAFEGFKLGLNKNFTMKTGDTFTPDGLDKDTTAIQDFYGSKGYIDVAQGQALRVVRSPNVDTGTMDLEFQIDEGEKSYVEKIDIRGNLKTKDKVIRRELAISPGRSFRHGAGEIQQAAPRRDCSILTRWTWILSRPTRRSPGAKI
jgi:outer membrane protein assembly factor BamA